MAQRNNGTLAFDRVVIETTGIADPSPILHSLVVDHIVGPYFRMDGVVTVADAATGPRILGKQSEATNQIAMADLVVLSKTDLVTPTELARFEAQIADINPSAQRIQAVQGQVPMGKLFGLSAMRLDVSSQDISKWLGMEIKQPDPLAGISGFASKARSEAPLHPSPIQPHAQHGHQIVSASIEVKKPISVEVFDAWLDTLIALKGSDILRMKGIVHVEDIGWPFVFHGIQHIFDAPVPLKNWKGTDTTSRVVVIARNMDQGELQASLETLHMLPTEIETTSAGFIVQSSDMPF